MRFKWEIVGAERIQFDWTKAGDEICKALSKAIHREMNRVAAGVRKALDGGVLHKQSGDTYNAVHTSRYRDEYELGSRVYIAQGGKRGGSRAGFKARFYEKPTVPSARVRAYVRRSRKGLPVRVAGHVRRLRLGPRPFFKVAFDAHRSAFLSAMRGVIDRANGGPSK